MSYFRICSICGANLDPGEQCDCRERAESEPRTNKEKAATVLEHREQQGGTGFGGRCFHLQSIEERGGLQA